MIFQVYLFDFLLALCLDQSQEGLSTAKALCQGRQETGLLLLSLPPLLTWLGWNLLPLPSLASDGLWVPLFPYVGLQHRQD